MDQLYAHGDWVTAAYTDNVESAKRINGAIFRVDYPFSMPSNPIKADPVFTPMVEGTGLRACSMNVNSVYASYAKASKTVVV